MTAEELMQLEGPYEYELVKGELLTMPLPGARHGAVTMKLSRLLDNYIVANNMGVVFAAETGFKLESDPDTVLGPDISFVSSDQVSLISDSYFPGPPVLAVEVLSPRDRPGQLERKTNLWVSLGVKSVWLVHPRKRTVEVVRASGRKLFHESDELVDDTVPGFHVPVSEIFN